MSRPPDPTAKISLLRAAEAVFAEKGLQLAKVEEITRAAGLSKGAFYLHFESKEEAFKQVVESFLARCSAILPPPDDLPSPESPEEALALWLDTDTQMYEFLWQNRAIVSILQGCQGEHMYLLETFNTSVQSRCEQWLQHWQRRGLVRRDLDTQLAATILNGAHHQLSTQLLAMPKKPPIAEWLRKTQAVFVRGFGTPILIESLDEMDNPPVSQRIDHGGKNHAGTNEKSERGERESGRSSRQGIKRRTSAKVS